MNCSKCDTPLKPEYRACPGCATPVNDEFRSAEDATIVVNLPTSGDAFDSSAVRRQSHRTFMWDTTGSDAPPEPEVTRFRGIPVDLQNEMRQSAPAAAPAKRSGIPKVAIFVLAGVVLLLGAVAVGAFAFLKLRSMMEPKRTAVKAPAVVQPAPAVAPPQSVATATSPAAITEAPQQAAPLAPLQPETTDTAGAATAPVSSTTAAATPPPASSGTPAAAAREDEPTAASRRREPAPEPESRVSGAASRISKLRERIPFGRRDSGSTAATFSNTTLGDTSSMKRNRYVSYAYVAPSAKLANKRVQITMRGVGPEGRSVASHFRSSIQNALNSITEEANGGSVRGEGAVYWSGGERWVEMIFRSSSGTTLAKVRQVVGSRDGADGADEAADAFADFYEEH